MVDRRAVISMPRGADRQEKQEKRQGAVASGSVAQTRSVVCLCEESGGQSQSVVMLQVG